MLLLIDTGFPADQGIQGKLFYFFPVREKSGNLIKIPQIREKSGNLIKPRNKGEERMAVRGEGRPSYACIVHV